MDQEDVRILEQIRQRLVTIEGNIRQLNQQFRIAQAEQALPSWNQIITIQKSVTTQLKLLQDIIGIEEKAHFLRGAHVYPTPQCPWNQENTVSHLLRKRLEPDISTWASKAQVLGAKLERAENISMSKQDWNELWEWAAPEANKIVKKVLGLSTDDSDADDDDDNDDDEDDGDESRDKDNDADRMDVDPAPDAPRTVAGPAMPLDQMLRIAVGGGYVRK